MKFSFKKWLLASVISQLTGCVVGPDYVKPEAIVATEFKELKGWKTAQPHEISLSSKWWEVFNDPRLNMLEEQVALANQSIIAAQSQYSQSQHLVQAAQSSFLPVLNMTATTSRFQAATGQSVAVAGIRNLFGNAVSVAWEPDLWGKVARQVEENTSNAQSSAATLQALQLSLQATLAQNYFQLNVLDAQKALLDETVQLYEKTFELVKNRYNVGIIAKSDVTQAQTVLESTRAQALNLGIARSKLEHAIAVLIGKTPAEVTLKSMPFDVKSPAIPVVLPSELLERRPDIAAAERKMSAANAKIGFAKAAYFPTLNLSANNGFQTTDISTLFTMARRYWALGPAAAAITIFDGGTKNAQYKQAIDGFDASVATYRQTVLTSFQEVEDNVAALRILADEIDVQQKAVDSANKTLELMVNQYQAGTLSYLNIMTAQTTMLANRQTAVSLQGEQLLASVGLIKALGGGWNETLVPTKDEAAGERTWKDYLNFPTDNLDDLLP
jgi:NodT family efflux transporter outer membrane factor (OMF) lipoprotein